MASVDVRMKIEEQEYHNQSILDYLTKYYINPRWRSYRIYFKNKLQKVIKKHDYILDLGCGPLPSIVPFDECELYCCADISISNLKNIKAQKNGLCDCILCDAESLPFQEGIFNSIISFGLLHHLPQPKNAITSISSILQEDGVMIAHEPSSFWNGHMESPHERGFTSFEIKKLFSEFSITLSTHNYLKMEFLTFKLSGSLKRIFRRWYTDDTAIWVWTYRLEEILCNLGIKGTDFLIICYTRKRKD
jgi:SAM-dependent methyltransferase